MHSPPEVPRDRFFAPPPPLLAMPRAGAIARLARPGAGINHVLAYGQSLSSGWDGWPALTTTPEPGVLMLGGCVRPMDEAVPGWRPVGDAVLRPLVARLQRPGIGHLLDEAGPQGGAMGETVLETALREFRRRAGLDAAQRLLGSSCGVGAQTIAALSHGAAPNLFGRMEACATLARQVADEQYRVAALLFLQGEHDSRGFADGEAGREAYLARLLRLHDDFQARVVAGIARQDAPAAMFIHQTGGDYASDTLGVAQAQLDAALTVPTVFLAAPVYPVPSRGGHLDANGYRWIGAQFGKVMHRVLAQGRDWRPLHPLRALACGRLVHVDFHVPAPPLAFGLPFHGATQAAVPEQGFAVTDDAGPVPIAEVVLDGARSLRIVLERPAGKGARLRYAAAGRHAGRGGLHDSDPDEAGAMFVDLPGAPPSALAGRPYGLANWCVAFTMPLPGGDIPPSAR